jgi:hypothetical protein
MGVRHAAAVALIVLAAAAARAAEDVPPRHALALAMKYFGRWHDTLASLVADEDYTQELRRYRQGSSGTPVPLAPIARQLHSEMLLLRAPAEGLWLSFRDVISVDGKAIADRQTRFETLFSGPEATIRTTAERIAAEGARYNLGRLGRTINTPIAPLVLLQPRYAASTTWTLKTNQRLDGRTVWILSFDQRKPPYAVVVRGDVPYPSSGRFWLEPGTGRIFQGELSVRGGPSISRVLVRFGPVATIQEGWVPVRLEEEYDVRRVERLHGVATYSNHRLFRTGARIVTPPVR